jgi:hypothetical protein
MNYFNCFGLVMYRSTFIVLCCAQALGTELGDTVIQLQSESLLFFLIWPLVKVDAYYFILYSIIITIPFDLFRLSHHICINDSIYLL